MPISTAEAFQKRHITREDGVSVLPRTMIPVAALEAGYSLASPAINDAVSKATYPGQMTAEEFNDFCEKNKSSMLTAEEMAKSVVVVAPAGVITRGSLEEIINKSTVKDNALSEEEVDALFTTLDTENKGAITAEDFMRALYGEDGVYRLAERRKLDAEEARRRKAAEEKEAREREAAKKAADAAAAKKKKSQPEEEKKKKASACC